MSTKEPERLVREKLPGKEVKVEAVGDDSEMDIRKKQVRAVPSALGRYRTADHPRL